MNCSQFAYDLFCIEPSIEVARIMYVALRGCGLCPFLFQLPINIHS